MNKKLATTFLATGLLLGGVGAASAYDGSAATGVDTVDSSTVESGESVTNGQIITIQDPDGATQEAPEGTEGDRPEGRRGRGECGVDAAAAAIGIDVDDLRTALGEGSTIADVAEANGVDPDAVVAAMVEAAEERLDTKVEAGRLTEEEADEKLEAKTDRIEDKVNGIDLAGDNA